MRMTSQLPCWVTKTKEPRPYWQRWWNVLVRKTKEYFINHHNEIYLEQAPSWSTKNNNGVLNETNSNSIAKTIEKPNEDNRRLIVEFKKSIKLSFSKMNLVEVLCFSPFVLSHGGHVVFPEKKETAANLVRLEGSSSLETK